MLNHVEWQFPLPRPHTGMMLGNGTTGMLAWGDKNHLRITIGRADLWDHRGGMPWSPKQNFRDISRCLNASDETGLRALFTCATENVPGQPPRPSVIPVGRLDLMLPGDCVLQEGRIDLETGIASIMYESAGTRKTIRIQLAMEGQEFCIELPPCVEVKIVEVPTWDIIRDILGKYSFSPPEKLSSADLSGWIQPLPVDPGLCLGYRRDGHLIWGVTARDSDIPELKRRTAQLLDQAMKKGLAVLERANRHWWQDYWQDIPVIDIPNQKLDFIYCYGLYKFAGFTNPTGIPATLQGPWIEEYRLPPWSSDYHFNINVQMCYWPAYKANRLSHLMPMFELVLSWREHMRMIAHDFVGIDDGYMMPHAVDDRCTCMGSFWTGTIDHGCAAWVAQMMYQYYLYSGDLEFLRTKAFDFMKGVMRVYEGMLEKRDGKYILPVSVSPEYRGDQMSAWGANASFQLAAIHCLCENLIAAAVVLGEKNSPVWADVNLNLPKASLFGEPDKQRIGLWNGTDLEESHRHHSHLAGICPFDAIDYQTPEWRNIVSRTFSHWVYKGMGLWSGWCMPWASMLQSRIHNGRMAELTLEIWQRVFTNQGHGTLHDADFPGLSLMGAVDPLTSSLQHTLGQNERYEIMQMDAGMGAVTAVQDMLMHSRRGIVYVFPGAPTTWSKARFDAMPCEGGALVSASLQNGCVKEFTVRAQRPAELRFGNPWGGRSAQLRFSSGKTVGMTDAVMTLSLDKGESCIVTLA